MFHACIPPTGNYMSKAWGAAEFRARHPKAPASKTYGNVRQLMEPLPMLLLADANGDSTKVTATLDLQALVEGRPTVLGEQPAVPRVQPSHRELVRAAKLVHTPRQPASQGRVLRLALSCFLIRQHIEERTAEDTAAGGVQAQSRRIVRSSANKSREFAALGVGGKPCPTCALACAWLDAVGVHYRPRPASSLDSQAYCSVPVARAPSRPPGWAQPSIQVRCTAASLQLLPNHLSNPTQTPQTRALITRIRTHCE